MSKQEITSLVLKLLNDANKHKVISYFRKNNFSYKLTEIKDNNKFIDISKFRESQPHEDGEIIGHNSLLDELEKDITVKLAKIIVCESESMIPRFFLFYDKITLRFLGLLLANKDGKYLREKDEKVF